jgi:hypothetical protein
MQVRACVPCQAVCLAVAGSLVVAGSAHGALTAWAWRGGSSGGADLGAAPKPLAVDERAHDGQPVAAIALCGRQVISAAETTLKLWNLEGR